MRVGLGIVLYDSGLDPALAESVRRAASLAGRELDVGVFLKSNSDVVDASEGASAFDPVAVLEDRSNVGFGAAHNIMMKTALKDQGYDYYLCLNPDTLLDPYFFAAAYRRLEANREALSILEARQFPFEHPKPYNPFSGETAWCSGAAMFINQRVFDETAGFDEDFFMYCEDVDLSWRVRAKGGKCIMIGAARVFHNVDIVGRKPDFIRRMMLESARRLAAKWGAGEFVQAMESSLINQRLVPDFDDLGAIVVAPRSTDFAVTDFRHHLSFCAPRW